MGKVIKRKVSGMGLRAKTASVLLFGVAISALMYLMPYITESAPTANGRVVYSNGASAPQTREYTASTNTFGSASQLSATANAAFMVEKACPIRNEHVAGYVTTGGVLYILRWNGTSWSNEWNVTVGGDGVNGRRFDIAYEKTSGRAMVVYSTNTATTNELAYRIWNGSTWTSAANINPARIADVAGWVKLLAKQTTGSNEIAMTVCDRGTTTANTADLTTMIWSGTAWGNEPGSAHSTNMYNTTGQLLQYDDFDMAYEGVSGDLLVVWTQATPQQYYRTYSGGTWGTATSLATGRAAPLQMIAVGDSASNNILIAFNRSASANVYGFIWDGSTLGTSTTVGSNGVTTAANKRHLAGAWMNVGGTSYAVLLWNTSTTGTIGYRAYSTSWGTAGTYSVGTTAPAWMTVDVDPQSPDTLMFTYSDTASDLFSDQLVLSGSGTNPTFTWSATNSGSALSTTLTNTTSQCFDFAYDRYFVADTTKPVVNTFTATSPSLTRNIPVSMTASDTSPGTVAGYLITTSATPPLDTDPGWSTTAPATYTVAADGTFTLYPWAKDSAGNVSDVFATPRTVVVDTVAPTVTTTTPANGATGVAVNSSIQVSWSENIDCSTVAASNLSINGSTVGAPTCSAPTNSATYPVSGQASSTTYSVTVNAVKDVNGNTMTSFPFSYTTVANSTVAGTASAAASSATSIAVTMPYTGDANTNNTYTVDYKLSSAGTWTNRVTNAAHTASPYTVTITGLTSGSSYDVRMTYNDGEGVSGTNPQTVTGIVLPANSTTTGAMSFTSVGTTSITVQAAFTGDANSNNSCVIKWGTVSGNYPNTAPAPTRGSGTYTTTVSGLSANTTYYFQATFAETTPDTVSGTNPVLGSQLTAGAWANSKLLHNSQNLGAKYGTWGVPGGKYGAFDCTTCHSDTTTNVKRIATTLTAPYGNWSTSKTNTLTVRFTNLTGFGRQAELRNSSTRICEVCHSKTTVHTYKTANATWTHNGNGDCTDCHFHNAAFIGAGDCVTCHNKQQNTYRRQVAGTGGDIDNGMTSHHLKYATAITPNDCTMCHDQANHKTYTNGVNVYLKNQDGGAAVLYDGTTANNGKAACLSCHDANGASSLGANANKPFTASGDNTAPTNINWPATGGAHDTLMACFNCHGKSAAANTTLDPMYNGHGSPTAKLLQDTNYSFTAPNPYCLNCHNSASTDPNKSTKNISGQLALAYKHTTPDCIDCHGDSTAANGVPSIHELKAGNHTTGATIANNLSNATGKSATWSAASTWPSTSNATFTNVNPATAEWHVCFKCHAGTGFATGGTGALSMTDLALEFNPNNQAYHPVAAALPATGNRQLASTALTGGWTPGMVMTCSDCHATDQASSYGPHGSSVKWMLVGTNKNWPHISAADNGGYVAANLLKGTGTTTVPTANFCFNCHLWAGGGGAHTQRSSSHAKECVGCHIRVPHGGKALRLLQGTNAPARYKPNGAGGGTTYMNGGTRPASGAMGESNCTTAGGCTQHNAANPITW